LAIVTISKRRLGINIWRRGNYDMVRRARGGLMLDCWWCWFELGRLRGRSCLAARTGSYKEKIINGDEKAGIKIEEVLSTLFPGLMGMCSMDE
jgi:hypothetical protein